MAKFNVDPPSISSYPKDWQPAEVECPCGKKLLVHCDNLGPFSAAQFYLHRCGNSNYIPGRPLAAFEFNPATNGWQFIVEDAA